MKEQEIVNATIDSAQLGINDHGILDLWLYLNYADGCTQGFGGFALYLPSSFTHHKLESVAGHYIFRVFEIAGVEDFSKLRGRNVRVSKDAGWNGLVRGVGHIVKDNWFFPADDFAELKEKK